MAAFHTPLSIGTDTGGSIRQPAALCGIVGIKPTYGRVSRYGIVAFASLARPDRPVRPGRAETPRALLHAIAGRDDRDSTSSPTPVPDALLQLATSDDEAAASLKGKRLGLPKEYFVAGMEAGVEARIREAVAALEGAGAIVEPVSLPHTDYGLATYYIVAPAEASANLARYDGIRYGPRLGDGDVLANYLATRGRGFGAEVKRRIMLGTYALSAGYYDAYYLKAQKVRTLIKARLRRAVGAGLRCARRPDQPDRRLPLRRPHGGPGLDVPVGRVHAAGQHGRPARDQHPVRPVRGPAGRAAVHRGAMVRGRRCSSSRAATRPITADAEWRTLEPTGLVRHRRRLTSGQAPRAQRPAVPGHSALAVRSADAAHHRHRR